MMVELLSVDRVLFEVLGYPMSFVELTGTIAYLASVWLIARRSMATWPVGIVSVLLFMVLFYQIQLYADALEQIYYLGASAYGWWYWASTPRETGAITGVGFSPPASLVAWAAVTLALSGGLGVFLMRIHLVAPSLVPAPASLPLLDALTTVMSFVAMWLLVRKRTESWVYWIVVDVIGIGLYWYKDVRFVALLYVVLLVLACRGLVAWMAVASSVSANRARVPG